MRKPVLFSWARQIPQEPHHVDLLASAEGVPLLEQPSTDSDHEQLRNFAVSAPSQPASLNVAEMRASLNGAVATFEMSASNFESSSSSVMENPSTSPEVENASPDLSMENPSASPEVENASPDLFPVDDNMDNESQDEQYSSAESEMESEQSQSVLEAKHKMPAMVAPRKPNAPMAAKKLKLQNFENSEKRKGTRSPSGTRTAKHKKR